MSTDGYRLSRKLHLVLGLIAALWLIFMGITGVLINHQEQLGLGDKEISNRFLPDSYRADMRTGTTRLNVVITDLHSGRFFGKYGYLISDVIALLLIFSVVSGVYMHVFSKYVKSYNAQNGTASERVNGARERQSEASCLDDSRTELEKTVLHNRN
jgi:uncharacterized iron-regulated membrane protein